MSLRHPCKDPERPLKPRTLGEGLPLKTQLLAGFHRVGVVPAVTADGDPLVGGSRVDFKQRLVPVEPHCRARKGQSRSSAPRKLHVLGE